MARFDVYPTPFADERKHTPFWLDVQADHLHALGTRVVVPMRRMSAKQLVKQRLNPEFDIEGTRVFADTANIGTYPLALLRRPVASLRQERMTIEDALDFLFTGF
jgi:toxin CcdB